jgi:hypothetical protein
MSANNQVRLLCEDGQLCIPRDAVEDEFILKHMTGNPLLLCVYDAGDCDTVRWPNPNPDTLRAALYRAREVGLVAGYPDIVLLPDGSAFSIGGAL